MAQGALAVAATTGAEMRPSPEALQITQRVVTHEHDISTAAAIPAIWPSLRYVGLTTEAQASVASGSGLDVDTGSILHCDDADSWMTHAADIMRASWTTRLPPNQASLEGERAAKPRASGGRA